MNIFLLVVTSDVSLREFVGTQKQRAFPKEAFVASRVGDSDSLLILIDQEKAKLAQDIRTAALVCEIDNTHAAKHYQNFLHDRLGKLAKVIDYLARHFHSGSDSPLLSLPLRNFKCSALDELNRQMASDPSNLQVLNCVDTSLKGLRRRVRPRKKTNFKTKYAVDDQKRFFVFGKERHSLPDTGAPHRDFCNLTALFRFGCRIDHTRHYNVSEGEGDKTTISGEFQDCHGEKHKVTSKTHINMFSNDFF